MYGLSTKKNGHGREVAVSEGSTVVQCAKKNLVSDSPGQKDFAIGLVNCVLNLPNRQVKYFEKFNLRKKCEINSAHQKIWGAS